MFHNIWTNTNSFRFQEASLKSDYNHELKSKAFLQASG